MNESIKNPDYRAIITSKRWRELRGAYMLKNEINNGGFCEQEDHAPTAPRRFTTSCPSRAHTPVKRWKLWHTTKVT